MLGCFRQLEAIEPASSAVVSESWPRSLAVQSWPLQEQHRHFELGHVLNCAITDTLEPVQPGSLSLHHAGLWECDLSSGRLIWSGGVYDLFGLKRGQEITRDKALSFYAETSRRMLEHVRSEAIRTRRGFTIDVEIHPELLCEHRWMRIIAAPVIEAGVVTRLHGVKLAL
jgi:PAS domain-containing protein